MLKMIFIFQMLFASNLAVLELEGESKSKEPARAKQEILDNLIETVSLQNIREILGEEQTQKKLSQIKYKILPNYGKYIPYIKQGNLDRSRYPWSMKVSMNFSRKALRDLLLQEGILHFANNDIQILPFISYLDRKYSKSYKWWFVDNNYHNTLVYEQANLFQTLLKEELWTDSFQVLDPIAGELQNFIPKNIRSFAYSTQDLQKVGASLNAEMVISGSLHYGPDEKNSQAISFQLNLDAILVASGRKVASIEKRLTTPAGDYEANVNRYAKYFYKESITQFQSSLLDSWKKGVFDTDRVKIRIYSKFAYQDLEKFKNLISSKSLKVKNLIDRTYAPNYIVLEADVSQGAAALEMDLKGLKWKGPSLKVWKSKDRELRIEI